MLSKLVVTNYRVFGSLTLELNQGLNILVGDNDAGKTTVMEAIHLALTNRLNGQWLITQLSPFHFNQVAADAYVAGVQAGQNFPPPEIIIDLYLTPNDEIASLRGKNNSTLEDVPGLRVRAYFDQNYAEEYGKFVQDEDAVTLVPTEYYRVDWLDFAGNQITRRAVPVDISRIDASAIRLHSGADYYLQQIIADRLDTAERVELSRAYRSLRETFAGNQAIAEINKGLAESKDDITDGQLSLSIDISAKTAWESSLVPHLDDLPFQHVGSGSQNVLKILLALNRSVGDAHVVLIEEPENHLSPGGLNRLIGRVGAKCEGKQVVVATHSSFVLNKLGLDSLILLHGNTGLRLTDLPADTLDYFRKLSGYDTLRLVLAESAVLVEGPSDELIVQRAYFDRHGKLPIEAGIDVINVRGLSFKRFLDIAKPLGKRVAVVTDNDGKSPDDVAARFADYTVDEATITIHTGEVDDGRTLEPQIVAANELDVLNEILGTNAASSDELVEHMQAAKTASALAIFGSDKTITMPKYICDAVGDE